MNSSRIKPYSFLWKNDFFFQEDVTALVTKMAKLKITMLYSFNTLDLKEIEKQIANDLMTCSVLLEELKNYYTCRVAISKNSELKEATVREAIQADMQMEEELYGRHKVVKQYLEKEFSVEATVVPRFKHIIRLMADLLDTTMCLNQRLSPEDKLRPTLNGFNLDISHAIFIMDCANEIKGMNFSYFRLQNVFLNIPLGNTQFYQTEMTHVTFGPFSVYCPKQLCQIAVPARQTLEQILQRDVCFQDGCLPNSVMLTLEHLSYPQGSLKYAIHHELISSQHHYIQRMRERLKKEGMSQSSRDNFSGATQSSGIALIADGHQSRAQALVSIWRQDEFDDDIALLYKRVEDLRGESNSLAVSARKQFEERVVAGLMRCSTLLEEVKNFYMSIIDLVLNQDPFLLPGSSLKTALNKGLDKAGFNFDLAEDIESRFHHTLYLILQLTHIVRDLNKQLSNEEKLHPVLNGFNLDLSSYSLINDYAEVIEGLDFSYFDLRNVYFNIYLGDTVFYKATMQKVVFGLKSSYDVESLSCIFAASREELEKCLETQITFHAGCLPSFLVRDLNDLTFKGKSLIHLHSVSYTAHKKAILDSYDARKAIEVFIAQEEQGLKKRKRDDASASDEPAAKKQKLNSSFMLFDHRVVGEPQQEGRTLRVDRPIL